MFIRIIKFFLAKREQVQLEREQRCETLIARLSEIKPPASFDDKEILKEWLQQNEAFFKEVSTLSIKEFRKTSNYRILVACKNYFEELWGKGNNQLERIAFEEKVNSLKEQTSASINAFNELFKDKLQYVNEELIDKWSQDNIKLAKDLYEIPDRILDDKAAFLDRFVRTKKFINAHNGNVHLLRIEDAKNVIGTFRGHYLDNQQLEAVIDDSHNHLVLAGAGTGKTTTIVGKVKYLLKKDLCKPEEILLLAYNNSAAKEMSERLTAEMNYPMTAYTFHKLGKDIIAKVENRQPTPCNEDFPKKCLESALGEQCKDPNYLSHILEHLTSSKSSSDACLDFKNQSEYEAYLKENPIITLNKEKVKSFGEMTIANFLFQNGIKYEYEVTYCVDTSNTEYGMYKPDFYLPDYKIYIEYFGINKEGKVPKYFESRHGKPANIEYNDSIEWKRETHKKNNTILVETYAKEKFEVKLLENLKKNLIEHHVSFNPISTEDIWKILQEKQSDKFSMYENILVLFIQLLSLTKSNDYDIPKLHELNAYSPNREENKNLINLFEPLFNAYNAELANLKQIDFDDMINHAAKYIKNGDFKCAYKYVIVDEYQDISSSRFNLIHSLRDTNNFHLFCVGDDWQSIYRFSGSDVSYILNFEKYWGKSKTSYIETTYRFPERLIEASGSFIMENPNQIRKNIRTKSTDKKFAIAKVSSFTNSCNSIIWRLASLPKEKTETTVFFIARYKTDESILKNSGLEIVWNNVSKIKNVVYKNRPDLKMKFITAHASKGLQADYVFILNNKNANKGFPSKIMDPPIMKLLIRDAETFDYAEERRLFYVAMTRAKKKIFFVVPQENKQSCFYNEIDNKFGKDLENELWECPICGGKLRIKVGTYGNFIGCENYRKDKMGCNYTRKVWEKRSQ